MANGESSATRCRPLPISAARCQSLPRAANLCRPLPISAALCQSLLRSPRVRCAGLGHATAGEPASFFVRAHDEFGRPKIMGGERFEAYAVPIEGGKGTAAADGDAEASGDGDGAPSSTVSVAWEAAEAAAAGAATPRRATGAKAAPVISIDLADLGNGSYEGRYTLRKSGRYALYVLHGTEHVTGSPFNLKVHAALCDTAMSFISGDGAKFAEAGVRSHFLLQPRDRFGNACRAEPTKPNGLPSDDSFEATLRPLRVEHRTPPVKCKLVPT